MKNLIFAKMFVVILAFGVVNARADSACLEKCNYDCLSQECLDECNKKCSDFKDTSNEDFSCDDDCVMENVVEYLQNTTEKLIDDVAVDYIYTLVRQNKEFSGKKYGFALVESSGELTNGYDEKRRKKSHCAAVIKYVLPPEADALCSYGINEQARIDFKGSYFTIVFEINDFRNRNVYKNYTTYKFIDDGFYLYQYSREHFKAGDKKGQFVLDKTDIFYRQPRDDKSKSVLIPISMVNQQFMENLEKQCYKNGKCKE